MSISESRYILVTMMMRFVVLTLLLFIGVSSASRIVGGSPAPIERYPSLIQIEATSIWIAPTWIFFCGGSILNSVYVLSAAHCFDLFYQPEWRRIRAGATYSGIGGVVVNVAQAINHPRFNADIGLEHDITVVRLASPLPLSGPTIQQAAIISHGSVIPDNAPAVYAGWGATEYFGDDSPILLDVQVYTINNDICRERYAMLPGADTVTQNNICAGVLDVGGRDACHGDSGGPLYYQNIVIGVVSWGHQCANDTFPGVNVAVAQYTNWIVETAV